MLENVEDYSHNLNPFGPPEDLAEIVATAIPQVGHYPDDSCEELKDVISRTFNVGTDCISVGAGSSDIIRNVPNTFYGRGDKVVIPRPSFAEYTQQCRIVGADIRPFELEAEEDFRIDADRLLEAAEGARAVYICNPTNPTGRVEPRDKLVRIARELEELTKSFAIPGIRIGFGFSNPDIIAEMDKVRMTWNVGEIEQRVATVLLRDKMDYVDHAAAVMAEESELMNSSLKEIGFPVGAVSDSFFYFNSLESLGMTGAEFNKRMINHGISVRDCASFGDRFTDYVRYSVKDRERNCRFIAAVDAVING